ncbi:MAG: cation:proton antiporter [Chloroflexi bacterium]|nr:cation:proton antiporter [Chloroflexota bacterium]
MSNVELATRFFLQAAVILAVCRLAGMAARRVGQPPVIGEMLAGIALGPSLFGWLAPDLQAAIFPKASMSPLFVVSQLGLTLYMFVVGAEFDLATVRRRLLSAGSVSLAGILAPFVIGAGIAYALADNRAFFPAGVSPFNAMLFLGASMCVTALPVLARILQERGLAGTPLGDLVLSAGAINDVAAWSLLAVVLASLSGAPALAALALGGVAVYGVVVQVAVRPLLTRLQHEAERANGLPASLLSVILVLLLFGAWFTEAVGVHAVIGGFLLGTAMPRGIVSREIKRLVEPVTLALLAPLYFVYSGLNTSVGLLDSPAMWAAAAVIVLAASTGKGVGCTVASLWSGVPPREALSIGALMNARGLMELIMLNIGLERGVITPALFSIMVIMAIVTTLTAAPIVALALGRAAEEDDRAAAPIG